jgi:hypothetical protein
MKFGDIHLLMVLVLVVLAGPAWGRSATVTVPMGDLSARNGVRGAYYILNVTIPEDVLGRRLDSALMELVVDVTASSPEDSISCPVVGVFPLTGPMGADGLDSGTGTGREGSSGYAAEVPSVRPVAVGENRTLTLDITSIVKGWIADPTTNHGLVIGTLSGPAIGTISLKSETLGPAAAVRVTYFYQDRFGGRVSRK